MKNKVITITSANLNTGLVQSEDAGITITVTGTISGTKQFNIYASKIRIHNTTGAVIGWNLLRDADEEAEYNADPTNFALLPVLNNTELQMDIPQGYKLLVQRLSGTAGSNLDIEMINYN